MRNIQGFGRRAALAGASLLALGAATPVLAQTAPAQVEEVIVTAQKREERLLDVGLAVTSVSAETLRTQRVNSTTDLVTQVPNVDVKVTKYVDKDGVSHKVKRYVVPEYSGIIFRIQPGFTLGLLWPAGTKPDFSTRQLGKKEGGIY